MSEVYRPRKTTYAQVEYVVPGMHRRLKDKAREQVVGTRVKECDALIHVVRNFDDYGFEKPDPHAHFKELDQELILADLDVLERRLERLVMDRKRGNKTEEECVLLKRCIGLLEKEIPLRKRPETSCISGLTYNSTF